MFWADRIAGEILERFGKEKAERTPIVIRDEKTLSGRVHIGSMRGVAIHGAVHDTLAKQGIPAVFRYELNDFDPMDGFPVYLPEEFRKYMGMPLRDIPSPDASAKNFAEYFANDFKAAIAHAGFEPEYYWASELYLSGRMDGVIREALENADRIRSIYKEVSGSTKKEGWLPLSVICPQCKKVATTVASDFDGETVLVNCYKTAVDYTEGCGFEGRISPFGGKAKLPWKVEWPAKWKVNDVMVEGGGKDHSTKGGSRDVANHIARDVFNYEPPFDVPYEFILVGGKKMSSSKGRGSSAHEIADLLPTKIFRLMLLGKDINQQVNFDPEGDTIPVLYDQYDKLAAGYALNKDDDYARLYEMIHIDGPQDGVFLPRFSQVAFLVQMPHLNLEEEVAAMKGRALTDADKDELAERVEYAKRWLQSYAPEKFVFKLQDTLPAAAHQLISAQKAAIKELISALEADYPANGEAMHALLREIPARPGIDLSAKEFFTSFYILFFGKDSGPQAGWFLAALPRDFVLKRLREAIV
ncbi:MAG TPA: lysine--tRNA ligase [Candidatus Paceibacterota bacterium]|nr:lysine--tRNA ligase [Candidatus Paceibacterota bacterium]